MSSQLDLTLLWPIAVMALIATATIVVAELTKFQKSKTAAQYPVLDYLAGLGVRIGNDALAMLQANPSLTPQDALTWAEREFRNTAPDAITSVSKDLGDLGVSTLVRRGLLTAANAASPSTMASTVIVKLSPKGGTAIVAPPVATSFAVPMNSASGDVTALAARVAALEGKSTQTEPKVVQPPSAALMPVKGNVP